MVNDSILTSIKKLLGLTEEDDSFDMDIIIHINSVFSILKQLGVGPEEGFSISDDSSVWTDFVNDARLNDVKSYVYLKVKQLFDPPTVGAVAESTNNLIKELEWRMNVEAD